MQRQVFSVSLLFENISDPNPDNRLWEESIVLIEADSEEKARFEAETVGKSHEVTYHTRDGGHADWRFIRIERVYDLDDNELVHGCEVFSRFLRKSEVDSLLTPFE